MISMVSSYFKGFLECQKILVISKISQDVNDFVYFSIVNDFL